MPTVARYLAPINSIVKTKLVTIVPPVATASRKRSVVNMYQFTEYAVVTPDMSCRNTAARKGNRRPNLENKLS